MSKIDYQALREAAVKAGKDKWQAKKINGDFFVIRHGSYTRQHGYTSYQPIAEIDCKPVRDFVAKANPDTVLELLDELEAAKKRIAELEERQWLTCNLPSKVNTSMPLFAERKLKSIACVMTTGISESCSGNMTA